MTRSPDADRPGPGETRGGEPYFLVDAVPAPGPFVLGGPQGRHAAAVRRLTDAGFATLAAAAPGHVEAVRENLFDALAPNQVDQLTAICGAGDCQQVVNTVVGGARCAGTLRVLAPSTVGQRATKRRK